MPKGLGYGYPKGKKSGTKPGYKKNKGRKGGTMKKGYKKK